MRPMAKLPPKASTPPAEPPTKVRGKGKAAAATPEAPKPDASVKPKAKRKRREATPPPLWNAEDPNLQDDVFERIAEGESTRAIATVYEVSGGTVWNLLNRPQFDERYMRARQDRAHNLAQRLSDIGELVLKGKVDPNAARVAIDAFKWTASKLLPKSYGDKLEVEAKMELTLADAIKSLSAGPVPGHAVLPTGER